MKVDAVGSSFEEAWSDLYGAACDMALAPLADRMAGRVDAILEKFFALAANAPFIKQLLDNFTPEEATHVADIMWRHVNALLAPGLTAEAHRALAERIGHVHANVGLQQSDAMLCIEALAIAIRSSVDASTHADGLGILVRRLSHGLRYQNEVYAQIKARRGNLIIELARALANLTTYASVVDKVIDVLRTQEDVLESAIGYPDALGGFPILAASGERLPRYLGRCAHVDREVGTVAAELGPIGLAWSTGQVQRSVNIATDARMALWKDFAGEEGLRSMAAIPLHGPDGAPMLTLLLYSAMPGGFSGASQVDFVTPLQAIVELALARVWRQKGAPVSLPFATRQRWQSLLRGDGLVMYYQPLLDLKTRRVTKVEALARLRDGDRILMPGQFLPAFRSEDYYVLYVRGLRQVLARQNEWRAQGLDLAVSINLPPQALGDLRYLEATREALAEYSIEPSTVTLELLETSALPSGISVTEEIQRLRSLGVRIALDDLGAGYGSLNRLRDFPFDAIKIDQHIVAGGDHSDLMRFVYQLTRLGHSLGKPVVVEGVEDEDLLQALLVLGPDLAQGYAIARPMPPEDVAGWVRTHASRYAGLQPEGRMARLAHLLLWEEGIHLNAEMARSACANPPFHDDVQCLDTRCRTCLFSRLPIEPGASPAADHHAWRLVEAAISSGVGSEAYRKACAHIIGDE